jgi:RNA polymerase sigma-70 factor, ECF subfamily
VHFCRWRECEAFLAPNGLTYPLQSDDPTYYVARPPGSSAAVVGQKLVDVHRFHLGTKMRDAGQEVSLYRGALPQVTSHSLAEHLLGKLTTTSRAAMRVELKLRVQEALNSMDPQDREVLILRHFEDLSNAEAAQVLGIKPSAAVNRYVRALKRLKDVFQGMPGGIGEIWG